MKKTEISSFVTRHTSNLPVRHARAAEVIDHEPGEGTDPHENPQGSNNENAPIDHRVGWETKRPLYIRDCRNEPEKRREDFFLAQEIKHTVKKSEAWNPKQ